MEKLQKENNSYFITKKKGFNGCKIEPKDLFDATKFAYLMAFGKGEHRAHRTGGNNIRKNGEIFCNTFQGKLAELVLYRKFKQNKFNPANIDLSIHGKGIWDDTDLEVNDKKINVKSVAHFSNLLLLEQKDWNNNAEYLPNISSDSTSKYHFFILVRIREDIKNLFKKRRLLYSNNIPSELIKEIILDKNNSWFYDIPGWISNNDLKYIINNDFFLPQKSLLNGRISMDASNYYCQAGDMKNFNELLKML